MDKKPGGEPLDDVLGGIASIRRLAGEDNHAAALALTDELLERFPACAALWLFRGRLLLLSDDEEAPLEEVARCYENAMALAPHDPEGETELGYFLYAVQDRTEAGEERFAAAAGKARALLRDALIGQLKCALERGDRGTCRTIIAEMEALCPDDDDFEFGFEFGVLKNEFASLG